MVLTITLLLGISTPTRPRSGYPRRLFEIWPFFLPDELENVTAFITRT
jgi:hypothetical protein